MVFYKCEHCGNIIAYVDNKGVPVVCCGQEMTELIPGTVEASKEKHIPVITIEGQNVTVTIGEIEHPMLAEHYIDWIALQTKEGNQRKALVVGGKPEANFVICDTDEVVAAYAYCNLHGLWKG